MENILGKRIRALREKSGYSQREFAKMMNISYASLNHYELGERIPNDNIKIQIATFFNVSLDYLMGRTLQNDKTNILNDISDELRNQINELYSLIEFMTEEQINFSKKIFELALVPGADLDKILKIVELLVLEK